MHTKPNSVAEGTDPPRQGRGLPLKLDVKNLNMGFIRTPLPPPPPHRGPSWPELHKSVKNRRCFMASHTSLVPARPEESQFRDEPMLRRGFALFPHSHTIADKMITGREKYLEIILGN